MLQYARVCESMRVYLYGGVIVIKELLKNDIKCVVSNFGIEEVPDFKVEIPPEGFGDYSTNVAFLLTKKLRKSPKMIAEDLSERFSELDYVSEVSVAGPGFINFVLNDSIYRKSLSRIIENPQFWKKEGDMLIQFEFGSANPTGPYTIGHGRQLIFGDVLCNVFQARGYCVHREMYINDAGRQIKLLGRSLWVRYNELFGKEYELPEDGYRGEYLIDLAKELETSYGDRFVDRWDPEVEEFFKSYAVGKIMEGMKESLERLGMFFDNYFSEKTLVDDGSVEEILRKFDEMGLTYMKDGALWFAVSKFVDDDDKVLVRSDGTYTYFLTDIAYHYNKFKRGYRRAYDIWGADHMGHIPRMKAAMKALGIADDFLHFIIHQYVNIKRGGEVIKMSTRKGQFSTLDELVESVGRDATRYFFAMFDPDTHMLFDIDLAKKKNNENPVFYVQYAHARIASIFRTAEQRGMNLEPKIPEVSMNDEEKRLIKQLGNFPEILDQITEDYKTNRLTNYLESLAGAFHAFYNKHVVVDVDSPELSAFRLALCKAVKNVLSDGLSLLGVSAPESM